MTANKLEGKARELVEKWLSPEAINPFACAGAKIRDEQRRKCADELAAVLSALDAARQHEIRDHEHQHSCSYYCDRPECVKAQRDELREAYVARQSEGMVPEAKQAAANSIGGVIAAGDWCINFGTHVRVTNAEFARGWNECRALLAAAPADAGEATQPERDGRGNG